MEDKIIWQPEYLFGKESYGFRINLDKDFAKKMISSKIDETAKENLNKLILKNININYSIPLGFYKDTVFLQHIYIGNNGTGLNVDASAHHLDNMLEGKVEENLEYNTHNVDNTWEAHTIISLFEFYIRYSDALIKKS